MLFAFGWGSVAAVIFALVAEVAFSASVFLAAGEDVTSVASLVVGAPLIEEACKGVALLLLLWFYREEFDNVLDGLIYGALIGLGFSMTENLFYFITAYREDGVAGLGELFVIRAVINGFGHAMYTGVIGASVGWSRSRYQTGLARFLVPVLGYAAGVLLHMLWNGGIVAISRWQGEDASVWSVVLIETPLFVIPPLVLLYYLARKASAGELMIIRDQLQEEVALGVLTPEEFEIAVSHDKRVEAMRSARRNGGWKGWYRQRQFFEAVGDIAFRKYHLQQGQVPEAADWVAIRRDRAEIYETRRWMAAQGERRRRS